MADLLLWDVLKFVKAWSLNSSTIKPDLVLSTPDESRTWKYFVSICNKLSVVASSTLLTLFSRFPISFIVNLLCSIFLILKSESLSVLPFKRTSNKARVWSGFVGTWGSNACWPLMNLIIPSLSITIFPATGK